VSRSNESWISTSLHSDVVEAVDDYLSANTRLYRQLSSGTKKNVTSCSSRSKVPAGRRLSFFYIICCQFSFTRKFVAWALYRRRYRRSFLLRALAGKATARSAIANYRSPVSAVAAYRQAPNYFVSSCNDRHSDTSRQVSFCLC